MPRLIGVNQMSTRLDGIGQSSQRTDHGPVVREEFIARVLANREGRPWIMRRRTQAEMDELVRNAGFEKISQEIDPCGIFTVSAARRVES